MALGQSYRESMRQMATMSNLEVWYSHVDVSEVLTALESQAAASGSKTQARMAATATKLVEKARTKDSMKALDKLTHVVDGQRRIISDPPLARAGRGGLPRDGVRAGARACSSELLRRYRQSLSTDRRHLLEQYRFSQMARKVVGVGSVGTRAWVILLHGASHEDVLFLQAKEAEASVLERFTKKSQYGNHGARVVAGQRLMQASSDIFLGWQRTDGVDGGSHDYYVRQLQDWKGSIDTETMIPQGLEAYGKLCALTLARAHARSGDRFAMAAYLGNSATLREGAGQVRRVLCRPERAGLRGVRGRLQERPAPRRRGGVAGVTASGSPAERPGPCTPVAEMCDAERAVRSGPVAPASARRPTT